MTKNGDARDMFWEELIDILPAEAIKDALTKRLDGGANPDGSPDIGARKALASIYARYETFRAMQEDVSDRIFVHIDHEKMAAVKAENPFANIECPHYECVELQYKKALQQHKTTIKRLESKLQRIEKAEKATEA